MDAWRESHTMTTIRPNHPGLSDAQFREALQGVSSALIATDPDGRVVYVNDAARNLYGFRRLDADELHSLDLQRYVLDTFRVDHVDGTPLPDAEQPLIRALRGERYQDEELQVLARGDEQPKVFQFSSSQLAGDPPLNLLTIRDITDRWRAERRYRIAFESDPAPALIARLRDGMILDANQGFLELGNLRRDALGELRLADIDLLPQADELHGALEALRRGERLHKQRTTLNHRAGPRLEVLVSGRAIELEGTSCGLLSFVDIGDLEDARRDLQREMEERQRTHDELLHARSRLADQEERQRNHLARDLHDSLLQRLLTLNMKLAARQQQLLADGAPSATGDGVREILEEVRLEVLENAALLRRTIRGYQPLGLKEFGLKRALQELADEVSDVAELEVFLREFDERRFREELEVTLFRVAQEGIHNAVRHAEARTVLLSLAVEDGVAELRIEDDGRGFEVPEQLATLQRDDHFGLLGMEERVTARGGTLEVRSEVGRGTELVCRLPVGAASGRGGG